MITGEAYGSAYVSMNSKHIGADLVLALDSAKVGVMDAKVAAQILCEDEISQAARPKKHWKKRQKSLSTSGWCHSGSKRGYVDNVISGSEIRKHLIYALQMFGMR